MTDSGWAGWGGHNAEGSRHFAAGAFRLIEVETIVLRTNPQGFTSADKVLADIAARPGMDDRLARARAKLAALKRDERPASLATLRLRAGLSQKDLAAKVGTSQPVISMYEAGEREPTLANIKALSEALGVDYNQLIPAILVHG
ncbi:helix-turn-helix transcriptional regulator [Sphingobium yanoikuyae]|uniref:helix-turn-helix domain-containing protein n=1 Tax=Sphingobium yanoikuyae TaxID=13690 RepID=UPI00240F5C77|nr:helix-turn-helix transcriptional regulator [Sphingobium yanoikuyae]MDG2512425.1 helix-turn-helix transcriptional regulator [Sphingobium yanoikuyae]